MQSPIRLSLICWLRRSVPAQVLVIITAWWFIWHLGRISELANHASVWFPAAGLTYAALLVLAWRAILPICIASVLVTLWAGEHYQLGLSTPELLIAGVTFSIAHITPYLLASSLIRYLSGQLRIAIPLLITAFLISSAFASLMATVGGMLALVATSMMSASDVADTWLAYWIGDFAGVVVLAPFFTGIMLSIFGSQSLMLQQYGLRSPVRSYPRLMTKILTNIVLIMITMLFVQAIGTLESAFAIFFLAVTHMWIACTESPMANIVSLTISSFLIAALVNLFGLEEVLMVYQFAIIVIASNALFGIALPSLAADNSYLRNQIIRDSLTAAASRQYLFQRADATVEECLRTRTPLSVLVFDIDNFKVINDKLGHRAGDAALVSVTETVNQLLRPTDLLARYGGDEFVVLLPCTRAEDASDIAQRIRRRVSHDVTIALPLTLSIGGTQMWEGDNFTTMFERADAALYRAKHAGRDRVGFLHIDSHPERREWFSVEPPVSITEA